MCGKSMYLCFQRGSVAIALLGVTALTFSGRTAWAQEAAAEERPPTTPGKVAFDLPELPPANVELDLGRGLIRNVLGLGDAAIAGVLEGLMTSTEDNSSENARFVAQQLTSARELGDIASSMIDEVHIRVWNGLPQESKAVENIADDFDTQLKEQGWDSALKIRQQHETVRVYVQRDDASVRGVLIIAGDSHELVMANVIGDLAPDKVQQFTKAATQVGVELGLDKELNKAINELRREIQP